MDLRSDYASARFFVGLCREAGIGRMTRNYLWIAFRDEGYAIVTVPQSPATH